MTAMLHSDTRPNAAHGQGASMALEDAIALEELLADVTSKDEVERRLELFEKLGLPRAGATQAFSNYMTARGAKMVEEVRKR